MSRSTLVAMVVALSLLGIADAAYLTESALTGTALSCGIAGLDGCNIVAQSAYSRLLGIPLAVYGLFFYSIIFILAIVASYMPRRWACTSLLFFGAVGALFSLYFMGLQVFVIKALCVYCLASFIIATLIFIVTLSLWNRFARRVSVIPAIDPLTS